MESFELYSLRFFSIIEYRSNSFGLSRFRNRTFLIWEIDESSGRRSESDIFRHGIGEDGSDSQYDRQYRKR